MSLLPPTFFKSRLSRRNDLRLKNAIVQAASSESYYRDSLTAGIDAQSYQVRSLGLVPYLRLASLFVRCELPAGDGESVLLRFYRYRKVEGVFDYTQITDAITIDASTDWSVNIDLSDAIRDGFELDPTTDSIAVSCDYTAGVGTLRAFRVDFSCEVANDEGEPLL